MFYVVTNFQVKVKLDLLIWKKHLYSELQLKMLTEAAVVCTDKYSYNHENYFFWHVKSRIDEDMPKCFLQ